MKISSDLLLHRWYDLQGLVMTLNKEPSHRSYSLLLNGGLNALRVGGSSRSKIVQLTISGVSWSSSVTPINLIVVSISSLSTIVGIRLVNWINSAAVSWSKQKSGRTYFV